MFVYIVFRKDDTSYKTSKCEFLKKCVLWTDLFYEKVNNCIIDYKYILKIHETCMFLVNRQSLLYKWVIFLQHSNLVMLEFKLRDVQLFTIVFAFVKLNNTFGLITFLAKLEIMNLILVSDVYSKLKNLHPNNITNWNYAYKAVIMKKSLKWIQLYIYISLPIIFLASHVNDISKL